MTNTSPVIALAGIGELRLYELLFDLVLVPSEVFAELVDKVGATEPDALLALPNTVIYSAPVEPVPPAAASLDAGERDAIALAMNTPRAHVLLDESAARKVAGSLGLRVRGTLGLLVRAKERGFVPAVAPLVHRMLDNGCRFAPDLVLAVLESVGEGPVG